MRAGALSAGLTKQEVTAHLVYCSGFHGIMGKYKVFWDNKLNPNMDGVDRLEDKPEEMEKFWKMVKGPMYRLSGKEKQLGLGEKGVIKYFTHNCDMTNSEQVNRFMKTSKLKE